MSSERIPIDRVRASLVAAGFPGRRLHPAPHHELPAVDKAPSDIADLYARLRSTPAHDLPEDASQRDEPPPQDWAFLSYVHTSSPHANNGLPDWAAADADAVLDALVDARILSTRAVWFDRLGMAQQQHDRAREHARARTDDAPRDWPCAATLHALCAPVICVPPTRTPEYVRYQIPDRWAPAVFDFYAGLEAVLRACATCGRRAPHEFDARLLNLAAALRAWPVAEAASGGAGRGAYVSFATVDRLQYTLAWYQTLLHVALFLTGYTGELRAKSVELYGAPLLEPCAKCLAAARDFATDCDVNVNCQVLDDALSALLQQANRFTLPRARPADGLALWRLPGLQPSPGDDMRVGWGNAKRLHSAVRRAFLEQARLDELAANLVRGRPAMAGASRHGDKWAYALLMSNVADVVSALAQPQKPGAGARVGGGGAEGQTGDARESGPGREDESGMDGGEAGAEEEDAGDTQERRAPQEAEVASEQAQQRSSAFKSCIAGLLLRQGNPFGDLSYRYNPLEADVNRCVRAPPRSGLPGEVGLFNELCGVLPAAAVGEFLRDRGFSGAEAAAVVSGARAGFEQRLRGRARAMRAFDVADCVARGYDERQCAACFNAAAPPERRRTQTLVLAWRAKNARGVVAAVPVAPEPVDLRGRPDVVFSFMCVDATGGGTVTARGTFCRSRAVKCSWCSTLVVRVEVDDTDDLVEVHIQSTLSVDEALSTISAGATD